MLPAFGQMINNHYDELVNAINGMQAGDGDLEAALPILKTALQKEFPGKMSEALDYMPVSYTHLDVYKRQGKSLS